ncbi:carbohydrate kinase family protein [Candidatus Woesearchaeota archaeon]|nr:carbohydrate kinase family protein [Candidatus Woesearchaeota archaeon]
MFDVITLGSATIDAFCRTDAELVSISSSRGVSELIAYPVGSKILIKDLQFLVGGGGTNTAVAFSRLGLKTGYLGHLGKDENSKRILNLLQSENIEYLGKYDKINQTGYSVILDSIEEDRTILTFKGSNDFFSLDNISKKNLNAKFFYMCAMTGSAFYELEKVAKYAKSIGATVCFNPSNYIAVKGMTKLKMIKFVDILILNREELNLIANVPVETPIKIENILKLSYFGPKTVVVTDGINDIHAYSNGIEYTLKPKKVKVLETTGAGDAFGATFVASIARNKSIEDSLIYAIINSQSVITNYGAKNILLSRTKIDQLFKTTSYTVKKKKVE